MKIDFITSNDSKVKLANERLNRYGITVVKKTAELLEPQIFDVEQVAIQKAKQLMDSTNTSFIVEDSGLYIEKLEGFPGALMKPVLDTIGVTGLLKLMENENDRAVLVKSVLVFYNPNTKTTKSFIGFYHGLLAKKAEGEMSRGWKVAKIFIPRSTNKTLAMLNESEWQMFLDDFRKDDHYEKFGKWYTETYGSC